VKAPPHIAPLSHSEPGAVAAGAQRKSTAPGAFRETLAKALAHSVPQAGGTPPTAAGVRAPLTTGEAAREGREALAAPPQASAGSHGVAARTRGEPRADGSSDAAPEEEADASHARHATRAAAHPAQGEQPVSPHPTTAAPADAAHATAAALPRTPQEGVARLAALQGKPALVTPAHTKPARDGEAARDKKPREKECPPSAAEPALAATREPPQPFAAPQETRLVATRVEASNPAAAALPPPPSGAPDVQGSVMRNAANLRVDTGGLGALELHLRVRDGTLHLRVEGEGARAVEARSGELARALASEGLRLAIVEAPPQDARAGGEGGRGGGERRDAWQEARDARELPIPPQPRPAGEVSAAWARGVHVKA
jgi:hypothetical protein